MNNNFGPNSTSPRDRRAFAHAKISQFRQGKATYGEAFEAAHSASSTRKGKASGFGRALGNVMVAFYGQRHDNDTVVVSGLSVAKQEEIAAKKAAGRPYEYSPDACMARPDAQNTPQLKGLIEDPIAEGFVPLPPKQ